MQTNVNEKISRSFFRAALFDLDGLMIDSERPYIKILACESKKRGFNVSTDVFASTIGIDENGSERILLDAIGDNYPYEDIRKVSLELFAEYINTHGIDHKSGLLPLLNHLKEKQIPIAVATSSSTERGKQKLKLANIMHYFDAFSFGDEVENGKPAPDIFLLAAARLNVALQDCIGFEDSPAGLCALRSGGIKSVFIKDTVQPEQSILDSVYRVYESLDQAIELF